MAAALASFGMKLTFPELPGWTFEVRERSAGVYEATGSDASGRRVETVGTDDNALLKECREMAAKVVAEAGRR